MPLLGYLGYLPFALEVYLLKELILPGEPRLSLSAERRESEAPEVGAPAA